MAKQYTLTSAFAPIEESSGIIYNAGSADVELASDTNQKEGQGLILRSGCAQEFSGKVYARARYTVYNGTTTETATVNVVDFSRKVKGGGSTTTEIASCTCENMNRLHLANGMQLWLTEEAGKPILRVATESGEIWKFADFVKEKGVTYVLLENGEIYNANWLQDHPNYVKNELIGDDGGSLLILKTIDADADVAKVQALTEKLDFDHFWDVTVDQSSGSATLNLDALTTKNKYDRTATKDAKTGKWTITGDNMYGELGIGYGQPYVYDSKSGHNTVLAPEFETTTNSTLGLSYVQAKDPSKVYPNAHSGDIYILSPAKKAYLGNKSKRCELAKMSSFTVNSVSSSSNATAEKNPDYDITTTTSGSQTTYSFSMKDASFSAIQSGSSKLSDIRGRNAIFSDYTASKTLISLPPEWRVVDKYNGSTWKPCDFMTNLTSTDYDTMRPFNSDDILEIACGTNFTVFLLTDLSVWTCGANFRGQLGAGDGADTEQLVISPQPLDITGFSHIAATEQTWVALGGNGILYGCGANTFGQLGQGDTTDRKVLTPIADHVERCELTAGNLIIRKTTGEVYGAGWNYDDRLNLGTCGLVKKFTKLSEVSN